MKVETNIGFDVEAISISDYFDKLVNRFFKILPMKEQGENSLSTYIRSMQIEMFGFDSLFNEFKTDNSYITLLSILQYLADNPDADVKDVRREVFRAISICKKTSERLSK